MELNKKGGDLTDAYDIIMITQDCILKESVDFSCL